MWRGLLFAASLVVLSLTGCTREVQGTAKAPEPRCAVEGFEDLPLTSGECGQTFPLPGLVSGYTARKIKLDGHEVLYVISSELLDKGFFAMPDTDDPAIVRPYAHTAIHTVQRVRNADVVQIVVSDSCSVESVYDSPELPVDCAPAPSLGWLLDAKQAAKMLPPSLMEGIETVASAAERSVYYLLDILPHK